MRDNTAGNAIATFVNCTTQVVCRYVDESDCSHAVYMQGAMGPPRQCSPDNTALGVELILL